MSKNITQRDTGRGLNQVRVGFANSAAHWIIEGYDVYAGSAWEGTHTSRWAEIEKDGEPVERVGSLSEARGWIRQQAGIAMTSEPDAVTEEQFADCDTRELAAQIGIWNLRAISGGRVTRRATGITLPVAAGYSVTIDLAGDDTYTVRRVFKRGPKTWIKGEVTGVYCDQVGEMAYQASCFRNVEFGARKGSMSA